jgi:outer membrane protein OmpA-like peptidoglycan-associated protein
MSEIQTTNYPSTAKVLVRSENMSRTALGIAHAYLLIYPDSTVESLNKAFPKEQFEQGSPLFLGPAERKAYIEAHNNDEKSLRTNYFYEEANAMLKLKDGSEVAVLQMWSGDKFPKLVDWAKRYDIYVAEFAKGARGKLGFFDLEYLNNWKPLIVDAKVKDPEPKKKKKSFLWLWILLLLIAIAIIVFLLMRSCQPKEPETIVVRDTVVQVEKEEVIVEVHDTLYVQQLAEIEENFNAAQFKKDKADLSEDAKFVLHDLAKLMKQYPELRLRIEGHTSAEGDAKHNQKLSEARAQAAVDFLVQREGIEADRLEAAGFGSSNPKNVDDPKAPENRRTEFEIIK